MLSSMGQPARDDEDEARSEDRADDPSSGTDAVDAAPPVEPSDEVPADLTRSIELVRRAQGDDQDAVNRLFERYYERVRLIIRMRMGRRLRSYMESADILQDTFMAAVRGFDRFEVRDEHAFIHWLGKIAQNQIRGAAEYHHAQKRDRRREQAMESRAQSQTEDGVRFDPSADGLDIASALGVREELEEVIACAAELDEDQREILSLRLFEFGEGRWDEIAQAIGGLKPDAARMRFGRAVTALLKVRRRRKSGD